MPPFIQPDGPVRVVRRRSKADGYDAGEVLRLFTISGRLDAENCVLPQPDFAHLADVSFRIPTPVFGAGLIENIPETVILANQSVDVRAKRQLGISGRVNRSGSGRLSRFGWKAQNASLVYAAAEAYRVEIGATDEMLSYSDESLPPTCAEVGRKLDDATNYDQSYLQPPAEITRVANYMRLLDQPRPASSFPSAIAQSITRGKQLFENVGCALCHTLKLKTGNSSRIPALNKVSANLYSDLQIHHMGPHLADGVTQGLAGPDEFRTAPLWGVGQRIFFLHDGRTSDLLVAIREHQSGAGKSKSEANAVIGRFNALRPEQQQDILDFLRSL